MLRNKFNRHIAALSYDLLCVRSFFLIFAFNNRCFTGRRSRIFCLKQLLVPIHHLKSNLGEKTIANFRPFLFVWVGTPNCALHLNFGNCLLFGFALVLCCCLSVGSGLFHTLSTWLLCWVVWVLYVGVC